MDNETAPLLMLQGRIMYRDRDRRISDVTHRERWGLKKMAEDGALASHILKQCLQRLELLVMATENQTQLDAELVRLVVQDVRGELEDGSSLSGYVHLSQEMFAYSEALPPMPDPAAQGTDRSLPLVKPVS